MLHPYRDLRPLGWVVVATLAALAVAGFTGITFIP